MTHEVQFCGHAATPAQLRLIIDCVQRFPALSREELANTLCEWLDWTGRDKAYRLHHLSRLISNSRFLILPWVTIPDLASHVLAMALRIVTKDWETLYGIQPWLAETLVDSQRFSGHCYRAANWIDVGQTTGRGRQDKEHLRHAAAPKQILLYPLRPNARKYLQTERLSNSTR